MAGNRLTRFTAHAFFAFALLLPAVTPLAAQTRQALDRDDDEGGKDEDENIKFAPIPVNAEAFQSHDEWFVETAKKIQNGTAKVQERRAWYELYKRYYPFTAAARPPANWRIQAFEQGNRLDPRYVANQSILKLQTNAARTVVQSNPTPKAATDYLWSGLGQNVPWYMGQPPANDPRTGTPDWGNGRGTAIWVNPNDKRDVLAGFADGGVWKTTAMSNIKDDVNAIWTPLTDFQPSMSIGSLVARVSATDSNRLGPNTTIWAATGEGNFSQGDIQGIGILKSTDGGATWSLKQIPWPTETDGTPMAGRTSIRRIALDPRNANNLWAAGDGAVWRSTDAGNTWSIVTTLPYYRKFGDCFAMYYTDLVVDDQTPAVGQPSHVYAGFGRTGNAGCSTVSREDSGVFRTTDDGATWNSINIANANCPGVVAGTTSRGYGCVGGTGAFGGLTNSTTVNGNVGRVSILQSPSDKKHLYVLLQDVATSNNLAIQETTNASAATVNWTARSATNFTNGQAWYNLTGAVDPANPAQLIVGGLEAYTSSNSAANLFKTSLWTGWGATTYVHADWHHVAWVSKTAAPATANDWIYAMSDGGFHVGTVSTTAGALGGTNGVSWATNNRGIMVSQAYGIGQSATVANAIHMGNQDNGEPKVVLDASNNIIQWWEIRGGDGGFSATDRTNHAIVYNEYVYGGIYRATNAAYTGTAGWNWACTANFTGSGCLNICNGTCVPDNATQFIAPFMLDRNNQARMYFGSRYVYRWTGGTTWVRYSPDLTTTNNGNSILWIHSANNGGTAGTVYATTINGRVWRSTNATCDTANCATWTDLTKAPLPARAASWVETDPTNASRAFVTFLGFNAGHVFRTTDGGTTWIDWSGDLPNEPFNSIAIDPANPSRVFVSSDMGMFVNEDGWNPNGPPVWIRINNGILPYSKVYSMEFSPANGKLRAPTHGRGVWELTVSPNSACGGTLPAAPTSVIATPASNQVTVTWNAVAGATDYRVYRTIGSSCPPLTNGIVVGSGITGTTFVDVTAANNTTYTYRVTALNAAHCEGPFSGCASACPPSGGPAAPTGVTLTPGTNTVGVAWNAVSGATSYEVWRIDNVSCPASGTGTRIASAIASTSYTDATALNGISYVYLVRAVGGGGCLGNFSSCATTCPPSGVPGTPVITLSSGDTQMTINWGATSGAVTYEVWRRTGTCSISDPGTRIANNVAGTSYNDTGLTNGTSYAYEVRAIGAGGCASSYSACATAQPAACATPSAPASVSATPTAPNTIAVTWSTVVGAASYKVYRAAGACTAPNGSYSLLVSGVTGTSYNDTTATFGNRYSYKVVTTTTCDSALSTSCAWAEAYGDCVSAPSFAGVGTVTTGAGTTCGINLTWAAGTTNCPGAGSISYTVYRGTTAGFAAIAANRIVSGVSGTAYTDANQLQAAVTYYYKVRAVDSRNNSEDLNVVEKFATAQAVCTAAPNDVQVFTVTATGAAGATTGQNVLQWVNPASGAPGTTVRVNFRTDAFPTSPTDSSATVLFTGRPVTFGAKDSFTHTGLTNGTTYYYAIWVQY